MDRPGWTIRSRSSPEDPCRSPSQAPRTRETHGRMGPGLGKEDAWEHQGRGARNATP